MLAALCIDTRKKNIVSRVGTELKENERQSKEVRIFQFHSSSNIARGRSRAASSAVWKEEGSVVCCAASTSSLPLIRWKRVTSKYQVLIHRIRKCYLTLKKGLHSCNLHPGSCDEGIIPDWLRGLESYYKYPYKRGYSKLSYTHEKAIWKRRQRLKSCGHKRRNASGPQNLEDARNRLPPKPLVAV